MKKYINKNFLKNLGKDAVKKMYSGVFFAAGVFVFTLTVLAFQAPSGGDTNPATAGYTSASSWISTTLTAIKSKTDTITTGSSFCDPNAGKYCNIKPTCDGTEASVVVDASKGTGYCIEKAQRTAKTWELAKMTCENAGKRLPEPFEWKYGCKNLATLSLANMTDDWEWASSNTSLVWAGANGSVSTIAFGGGSCTFGTFFFVGYDGGSENALSFRCVR